MNDEIIKTKNEIIECDNRRKELLSILLQQHYAHLETLGIKKGTIVFSIGYKKEKGIFIRLIYCYDRVCPVIAKIKKDGTAHSTATVYCFNINDMHKDKECEG